MDTDDDNERHHYKIPLAENWVEFDFRKWFFQQILNPNSETVIEFDFLQILGWIKTLKQGKDEDERSQF